MILSFKRILYFVSGLVLFTGLLTSCAEEYKVAVYRTTCGPIEYTGPDQVTDPELQDFYTQLLTDLMTDLSKLLLDGMWQVNVSNENYKPEDEKKVNLFNKRLPEVKELETMFKKRIEDYGKPSGSTFCIKVQYVLSRSVPADYSPAVCLQEYSFQLAFRQP